MAQNFNRRSDSSDSNHKGSSSRKSSSPRRTNSDRRNARQRSASARDMRSSNRDIDTRSARSSGRDAFSSLSSRTADRTDSSRTADRTDRTGRTDNRTTGRTASRQRHGQARSARPITVGEQRKRNQREARKKQRTAISVRLIVIAVVIGVLVVGAFAIYQSPLFGITSVRVEGAEHLTNEYLEELAAVPANSTLLRVDSKGIEERLEGDPWVADAQTRVEFPATLVLVIVEHEPFATVEIQPDRETPTVSHWLINSEGAWMGVADSTDAEVYVPLEELSAYPRFIDVQRSVKPVAGEICTDEGISNAFAILEGLSSDMRSRVASISAPDKDEAQLTLTNNVIVIFGPAEDISAKEQAIITLLNEHPDTLISINVRVASRPSYSSYGE